MATTRNVFILVEVAAADSPHAGRGGGIAHEAFNAGGVLGVGIVSGRLNGGHRSLRVRRHRGYTHRQGAQGKGDGQGERAAQGSCRCKGA